MKLRYLFAALCLCLLLVSPAAAAGGAGTAANPYVIETPAELQSIQNNLAAYYILGNDIDLSGVNWIPIGSTSAPFSGQLDGNGYTISNLYLSTTTVNTGIFSVLTSGATIKNLKLSDCSVDSAHGNCACLVGCIVHSGEETTKLSNIDIVRCSSSSDANAVGNLIGLIYIQAVVSVIDCTFSFCTAESTSAAASIVCGQCSGSDNIQFVNITVVYSQCYAPSGVSAIMGDCGTGIYLSMSNCVVDSCICDSSDGNYVGALCAAFSPTAFYFANSCTIKNTIIKGGNYIGGLFGISLSSDVSASECTVTDCTILATGNYAGGIGGRITGNPTIDINSCIVTDSTILATSYAASICPAFS